MSVQVCANQELNDTLQKFWKLESIGITPVEMSVSTSQSESTVLKKFKETLAYKNGRYEVSLPWKDEQVVLKDNYKQARSRLYNLERNLLRDSSKAKSYQEAINKYVEDGVAEEVPYEQYAPADGRPVFYLPHRAVFREDKQTTKTRVVFDASARDSNGVSLNSCLQAGPALHPDLVGILLRFRKNQVGVMGDVEKTFLQIGLKEEDRDSHRFLWRDLDPRVTFGVISSPFLAIFTTLEHARRCKETFPEASDEILRNTYVDDFASGKDTVREAVRLQQSSKQLMEQAAFNLTKWSSNSPGVMQAIPEKDRASDSLIRLESELPGMHPVTKALGLKWNTRTDSLVFMIELDSLKLKSETLYTKRELAFSSKDLRSDRSHLAFYSKVKTKLVTQILIFLTEWKLVLSVKI
ncbi:uncharacterized protein [Porites lutea]|uniref:uncharacterized protein n=1 Tax=Porites lutea TaxID=51062 RepID=UPI003CC5828F